MSRLIPLVPDTKPVMENIKIKQRTDINAAVEAWLAAGNVIEPAPEVETTPRPSK